MKVPVDVFLAEVELSGGAIAPPCVLALVATVRAYAGVVLQVGAVLLHPAPTRAMFDTLIDSMTAARFVELPDPPDPPS